MHCLRLKIYDYDIIIETKKESNQYLRVVRTVITTSESVSKCVHRTTPTVRIYMIFFFYDI